MKIAFDKIFNHLSDDGIFICTFYNPSFRIKTADGQYRVLGRFPLEQDKTLVVSYYSQYDPNAESVKGMPFYEIYNSNHVLVDKQFLDIHFSLISRDDYEEMVTNTGFVIKEIFGDYDYNPYSEDGMFMNFVLTKKITMESK